MSTEQPTTAQPTTGQPDAGSPAGLVVSGLTTSAGVFRLRPVDLQVLPGRVLVLLGPSGAGKTVLLDTVAGFHSATDGRVHLDGRDITALAPEQRRVAVVFQHAALFPHLSVADNIAFGPRVRREHEPTRNIADLLGRFGLTALAHRTPRSLSGGERQRVALARALAAKPGLLLLDEPFSALDQPSRETLRAVLHDHLATLDIPVVHITHDRDEALTLADDLAILVAGGLRQHGPARNVTDHPADPDVAQLVGWTELGIATIVDETAAIGALHIPAPGHPDGPARLFYRPEDVILVPVGHNEQPSWRSATVAHITATVPLARITLGSTPPLTALVHRRDLHRLDLDVGDSADVLLPPATIRVWPTAAS